MDSQMDVLVNVLALFLNGFKGRFAVDTFNSFGIEGRQLWYRMSYSPVFSPY